YSGGALTALFGARFQPLKERPRDFGLAFAAAHLVHIGLVGWLCWIGAAPPVPLFIFFGIALIFTYLLALFSIGDLHRALGPRSWWLLRTIGMNYIAFAFFVDFMKSPLQGGVARRQIFALRHSGHHRSTASSRRLDNTDAASVAIEHRAGQPARRAGPLVQ